MKNAKLFTAFVGPVLASSFIAGCDAQVPLEPLGQEVAPIAEASCVSFKDKFSCRTRAPHQCDYRGIYGGRGWDMCNWGKSEFDSIEDPAARKQAIEQRDANCKKEPGVICPPRPTDSAGRHCTKAIFGRFVDSKPYYGCPGYIAINIPSAEWSIDVNNHYEDCILFGRIQGLCHLPMEFVSPTNDIPDYDPSIPKGHEQEHKGQITAVEFCRALKCYDCQMETRSGGGFIPEKCRHL